MPRGEVRSTSAISTRARIAIHVTVRTDEASSDVTPFSIGIQRFETQAQTYWGQMMAASTVATVPLIVIFVLFQKPIVDGLTSGSVKE
nr:hypothetical protein [Natrarchaeobius halalkaliphilus]